MNYTMTAAEYAARLITRHGADTLVFVPYVFTLDTVKEFREVELTPAQFEVMAEIMVNDDYFGECTNEAEADALRETLELTATEQAATE